MDRFEADAQGRSRHRALVVLCRRRARCASTCRSTCSSPNPYFGQVVIVDQGPRGARPREGAARGDRAHDDFVGTDMLRARRSSSARRSAGRCSTASAGPTSQKVREHRAASSPRSSARNPRVGDIDLRLERAGAGREGRGRCRTRRASSASPPRTSRSALNGVVGGTHDHAGPRRHLSGRRHRPRARRRARLDRDAAEPADCPAGNGQSVPLAAVATFHYELEQPVVWRRDARADHHRQAGILDDTQPATDRASSSSPQMDAFMRKLAGRLPRRHRRHGRGERQGARADRARSCR